MALPCIYLYNMAMANATIFSKAGKAGNGNANTLYNMAMALALYLTMPFSKTMPFNNIVKDSCIIISH